MSKKNGEEKKILNDQGKKKETSGDLNSQPPAWRLELSSTAPLGQ